MKSTLENALFISSQANRAGVSTLADSRSVETWQGWSRIAHKRVVTFGSAFRCMLSREVLRRSPLSVNAQITAGAT